MFRIIKTAMLNPEISKALKLEPMDCIALWEANVHMEKIGDAAKRTARLLASINTKAFNHKRLLELISLVMEKENKALEAFHAKNTSLADEVSIDAKQIFLDLDVFAAKHKDMDVAEIIGKLKGIMSHVIDITRLVRYA